jgi:hypothetical protein
MRYVEGAVTYRDLCVRPARSFEGFAGYSSAGHSSPASWAVKRFCGRRRRWVGDVCDEDAMLEMEDGRALSGETRLRHHIIGA